TRQRLLLRLNAEARPMRYRSLLAGTRSTASHFLAMVSGTRWNASLPERLLLCVFASSLLILSAAAQDKITYQDHILPLVEANCSKCHNADKKKADLELTSYQGALRGSGSGAVLVSGNLDGSKLWKAITHAEEPTMPPNRPKLADKELEVFKKW